MYALRIKSSARNLNKTTRCDWLIDWLIRESAFVALDKNLRPGYNTLLLRSIQEIFIVHVHIDSSKHYLAFCTARLHFQTLTLMPVGKAVRQFAPFLCGLWYEPAGRPIHYLTHERWTRSPLSSKQQDVTSINILMILSEKVYNNLNQHDHLVFFYFRIFWWKLLDEMRLRTIEVFYPYISNKWSKW